MLLFLMQLAAMSNTDAIFSAFGPLIGIILFAMILFMGILGLKVGIETMHGMDTARITVMVTAIFAVSAYTICSCLIPLIGPLIGFVLATIAVKKRHELTFTKGFGSLIIAVLIFVIFLGIMLLIFGSISGLSSILDSFGQIRLM